MTLTSALLPAILATMLPTSAEPAPIAPPSTPSPHTQQEAETFLPPTPEQHSGQKCEMKEAKLVLLVPEAPRPSAARFQPGDNDLCLYYLGRR